MDIFGTTDINKTSISKPSVNKFIGNKCLLMVPTDLPLNVTCTSTCTAQGSWYIIIQFYKLHDPFSCCADFKLRKMPYIW